MNTSTFTHLLTLLVGALVGVLLATQQIELGFAGALAFGSVVMLLATQQEAS